MKKSVLREQGAGVGSQAMNTVSWPLIFAVFPYVEKVFPQKTNNLSWRPILTRGHPSLQAKFELILLHEPDACLFCQQLLWKRGRMSQTRSSCCSQPRGEEGNCVCLFSVPKKSLRDPLPPLSPSTGLRPGQGQALHVLSAKYCLKNPKCLEAKVI